MASSMKQHLADVHKKIAAHHANESLSHANRAQHFKKLAAHIGKSEVTEATKDSAAILAALAGEHEEMSQEHDNMAAYHADCQEKCRKATDTEDLTKLAPLPPGMSALTPSKPGIIAVPRAGQQLVPEKIPVPAEFEKLADIEA